MPDYTAAVCDYPECARNHLQKILDNLVILACHEGVIHLYQEEQGDAVEDHIEDLSGKEDRQQACQNCEFEAETIGLASAIEPPSAQTIG